MRSPPETGEPLREDLAPFFLNHFSLSITPFILFVVAVSDELQLPAAAGPASVSKLNLLTDGEKATFLPWSPLRGLIPAANRRQFQLPVKTEEVMNGFLLSVQPVQTAQMLVSSAFPGSADEKELMTVQLVNRRVLGWQLDLIAVASRLQAPLS